MMELANLAYGVSVLPPGVLTLTGSLAAGPNTSAPNDGTAQNLYMLLMAGATVGLLVGFYTLVVHRYRRCPSNQILVIYGKGTGTDTAKCIHGGAAFVWPLVQDYAYLSLEPIQIEIPLRGALSIENIRVNVPSVFTVAIGTQPEYMQNAAIRLLGLSGDQIKHQAQDIIFGQLRQVIASMQIDEINRDREKFLHNIQANLEPELKKVGLVLVNVNITDITDESGYIEAIGKKAASQAIQTAQVDVAEQEKRGAIGVAKAQQERLIEVANANKLREIGIREAQKEQAVRVADLDKEQKVGEERAALERDAQIKEAKRQQAVRVAELDKEQKIGEQTASYQRDAQIKEAEQKMRVSLAEANARAVEGENKAQASVAAAQAELQVRQAQSFQLGETHKREAEAAVQEAQNRALARAALAAAERIEAERRAAVEAPAKAEKAKMIVEAEAEAERRRIAATAEAAATFAQAEAEARGLYETLARKGEGLRQIISAAGGAQQAFQLLMLEHIDKLAETSAQAISNIKFDKIIVWEGGHQGTPGGAANGATGHSATANFLQSMGRTLPPMMQVMRDVGGVEMPAYFGKLVENGQTPTHGQTPEQTASAGTGPSVDKA